MVLPGAESANAGHYPGYFFGCPALDKLFKTAHGHNMHAGFAGISVFIERETSEHIGKKVDLSRWVTCGFNDIGAHADLAIDLGTANTLVYLKGKGIIIQEPSIVVVNRQTGKVEAVGARAKEMLGKTPTNTLAIKPMRDGVIADFEIAEKMLDHFIKRATNNRGFLLRPRIVIGIPTGITQVERRGVTLAIDEVEVAAIVGAPVAPHLH